MELSCIESDICKSADKAIKARSGSGEDAMGKPRSKLTQPPLIGASAIGAPGLYTAMEGDRLRRLFNNPAYFKDSQGQLAGDYLELAWTHDKRKTDKSTLIARVVRHSYKIQNVFDSFFFEAPSTEITGAITESAVRKEIKLFLESQEMLGPIAGGPAAEDKLLRTTMTNLAIIENESEGGFCSGEFRLGYSTSEQGHVPLMVTGFKEPAMAAIRILNKKKNEWDAEVGNDGARVERRN